MRDSVCTIESESNTVEVRVLNDGADEVGELRRVTTSLQSNFFRCPFIELLHQVWGNYIRLIESHVTFVDFLSELLSLLNPLEEEEELLLLDELCFPI